MLALMHLFMWRRGNRRPAYLLASTMALAAGCIALLELSLIMSHDIAAYEATLQMLVVAIAVMLVSLVWFVRSYLGTGSRVLLIAITTLWAISGMLAIALVGGGVYREVTELVEYHTFWGEAYSLAVGKTNPLKYLADLASVLILLFLLQASIQAWRRRPRWRAAIVGGGSVFFILLGGVLAPLQDAGVVTLPLVISFPFLAIVIALTWQVVDEALKADYYAREVEQLSRAVLLGEMTAGIAHEINQPLAAILSNAQAARRFLERDDPDFDEIREIVDDIIADDKRAGSIVHGMRGMLRREKTAETLLDVNDTVRSVVKLLAGDLHANDIVLDLSLQPEPGAIRADAVQMQQVLVNLILNSVRAVSDRPQDRRQVTISSVSADGKVSITVADQGHGIGKELMPRLFEPFVTRSKDGLGMGLAISRRIVERFGGSIRAENRDTGGAVFRVTMPLAEAEA